MTLQRSPGNVNIGGTWYDIYLLCDETGKVIFSEDEETAGKQLACDDFMRIISEFIVIKLQVVHEAERTRGWYARVLVPQVLTGKAGDGFP